MFTGFTDVIDINIPFKLSNPAHWNKKKPVFEMAVNKNFESLIEKALSQIVC